MNILNKEKILEQARAFIDEAKFDKAIREYEKILLADPTDLRVKLRIAELYTKRKQIHDAIRIYREVADAYTAEGFYLKAVTVYKNVLRLNPSLTEINEHLAYLYEKMGLTSDAVRQYDILAAALDLKGQVDRVLDVRAKIVGLNPKNGKARIRLAELYQREGRTEEALEQYEEYARQLEEEGKERGRLADLYEKILAHHQDRQDLMRKLIEIYDELGDHKKTLKWLEEGKEFVESDSAMLVMQARLYAAQNQTESARARYMMLAELEREAGNTDAALEAFFEILVLLPDEEERLEHRVEELKPGALPDLAARAQKRREELEAEEQRREEEEEAAARGEGKKEEVSSPGTPAPSAPKPEGKPQAKSPAKPDAESPPAAAPVEEPPRKGPPPARKDGDAAYDLGMVYRKMGLADEATAEFTKALNVYDACVEEGVADEEMKKRIVQIQGEIGGTPVAEEPPVAKEVAVAKETAPAPEPVKEEKKPAEKKPGSKKKISFV